MAGNPESGEVMLSLTVSSKGNDVKVLQQRLNVCGAKLKVDGVFGIGTANAVGAFQKHYGLTVDHIVGPKTNAKLIDTALCRRTTYVVQQVYKYKMGYVGGGYRAKGTLEDTIKLKRPGCTCGHFVSFILGGVGLLKLGKTVTHTPEGYGIGPKAIKGAKHLIDCDIIYPNKPLDACDLEEWDVLVHDSTIGIYAIMDNKPTVITGRSGTQTLGSDGLYHNLYITSGYEWKHNVLAVIRAVK